MELTEEAFAEVWPVIAPVLDERQKRVVAGAVALLVAGVGSLA